VPYDEYGDWFDDQDEGPLSPWEQAHGGHRYDPNSPDSAENDFDRATAAYYEEYPDGSNPDVNWYDPESWESWVSRGVPSMPMPPDALPTSGSGGMAAAPVTRGRGGFSAPSFDMSGFQWPSFRPSKFKEPDPFRAPSMDEAMREPGYEFARKEGIRALENAAGAKGVLRTGGTLKDLIGWGNQFAEQNYGNVYNRAGETYSRNYGVSRDKFDRDYRGEFDAFGAQERAAHSTFTDLYRRWKDELDASVRLAEMGME